ncbi:MAG: peptidoglycan DD-metalloendopeptidase family protein [Halanaerobiales bacterium]
MSNKENKDKYWFKIDRDKIKLQLKDIKGRFMPEYGRLKKFLLFLTFCLLLIVIFTIYSGRFMGDPSLPEKEQARIDMADTLPPEDREDSDVEIITPEKEELKLEKRELTLPSEVEEDNDEKENEEEKSKAAFRHEESEVTAPLRSRSELEGSQQIELSRPLNGEITQESGWYYHPVFQDWRHQQGLSIKAEKGEMVKAAGQGRVAAITEDEYRGAVVTLDHGDGLKTLYANLNNVKVAQDQLVERGFEIGNPAKGFEDEPSLYFEVIKDDEVEDVIRYLE